MKKIKYFIIIAMVGLLASCSDLGLVNLDVPYDMEPDREVALANTADLYNLIKGAYQTLSDATLNARFIHVGCMADQITTTNAYWSFWSFTMEPRNAINNSTTWGDLNVISRFWYYFNSVISSTNTVIPGIINDNVHIVIDDNDLTTKTLAAAYFARGLAHGYLGMIYDQGFVVDENTDLSTLQFSDYNALIDQAISDLQTTINILDTTTASFEFDFYPGSIDVATWKKAAYTYMARFEAARARTEAEAASVNWDNVLDWANNGITEDWSPASDANMANWFHNWVTYPLSTGAAYLPVDIKVIYQAAELNGKDYYWEYPSDNSVNLPDAYDNGDVADKRLENGEDFWYTTDFGYLREDRGRYLFSNYGFLRYQYNHPSDYTGNPMHILDKAEVDYLKAEAYLMKGDLANAKAVLEASNFVTRGGYDPSVVSTATEDKLWKILSNEYYIELFGIPGVQWYYMRRHDLLKRGTPTMYPVPASELEVDLVAPYTFGGDLNAGQPGTASGDKAWAPIHGEGKSVTKVQFFEVPVVGTPQRGSNY